MRQTAERLSTHLLNEARRYFGYPRTIRRTASNIERYDDLYRLLAGYLPWNTAFLQPATDQSYRTVVETTVLVDEMYCRELLGAVPEMVKRTQQLEALSLETIPAGPAVEYLREATRTYIAGFFRAAVALARGATEAALKKRVQEHFPLERADLDRLADFALRARLIDKDTHGAIGRVRSAGNRVLHRSDAQIDGAGALKVIADARSAVRTMLE
jgi:hypothetical protein